MNKTILIGRLTRDPEHKTFENGGGVANFTLAVNDRFTDDTHFINCQNFDIKKQDGTSINVVRDYCKKGHRLGVVGELRQENFKDKNGENRSTYKVRVNEVSLIETKLEAQNMTNENEKPAPTPNTNVNTTPNKINLQVNEDDMKLSNEMLDDLNKDLP